MIRKLSLTAAFIISMGLMILPYALVPVTG